MARLRLKKLAWATGGLILLLLLLLLCRALLLPLGLAAALCYILLPLVKRLEGYRLPGWLAIALVYAGLFSLLCCPCCRLLWTIACVILSTVWAIACIAG